MKMDRSCGLEMQPVNERLKRKYQNMIVRAHKEAQPDMHSRHRKADTEAALRAAPVVYVRSEREVQSVYEELGLRASEVRSIHEGFGVTKIVPLDVFEHWFGTYNQIDMGY
jgi:hypothetical protein